MKTTTWVRGAVVGALCLLGVKRTDAQSIVSEQFRVNSSANAFTVECGFNARGNVISVGAQRGFIARPPRHELSVVRVGNATGTTAAIDQIIDTASSLLQERQNPPGDVNCCVEMRRDGAVANANAPSGMVGGVVTTQAEQNAVLALNGNVKVVNGISWCGQAGSYAGCASGGTFMVTVGTPAATWAHELGHNQGLCHTAASCNQTCGQCGDCTCSDGRARDVMFCSICGGGANDTIRSNECTTYQGGATP
jgi:hypothetical protein